ncbi:hypothetical protein [Pseudarthrobacter sp. DSP2-3-2b1]|uniref:hypothetical protein n=1 Tax=Pseudarthrobacter sp. DSP2-3-2b1 TaxID=2804661 RepID=UPI003CEBAEC0
MKWWLKFGLVVACIFGILGAIFAGILWVDYNKSAAAVPRVRAAADQFVPGGGWTLTKTTSRVPERIASRYAAPGFNGSGSATMLPNPKTSSG